MEKSALSPAERAELNRLLDQALDLPPDDRERWLAALAPSLASLKPHLADLLGRAAAVETADFLNTLPPFQPVDAGEPQADRAGEIVGPYRLVRELGRGGMGSVWLAERADGLHARPIALKLPHGLWRAVGLAERMAREREILATLDHRNIAKLLDAGVSAQGQPYLAIEYVEGIPIDVYCAGTADVARPDLRTRLRLFQQAANAVAYAHGKLVIHRDLKPANILVSADGEVRLLDFGIAKLLEHGEARETQLTELSGRALTPDYASPEQILGLPLTVASDVYSLGVVLYELLAGARPYRLERDSRGALEDAILESEPRRPSEAAPAESRKALQGDLDTIVLKALKKNPQERYATANALAEDVRRYLEDLPVIAQPDSTWYRLRKFVVRNKLAVGAAAAIVAAVIVGVGVALWQARVAIAERDRAEEVKNFIATVFRDADPFNRHGGQLTGAALLRGTQQEINEKFANRPALRVELLTLVGSSLLGLGEPDSAEKALQQAAADASRFIGPTALQTVRARVALAGVHHARRDMKRLGAEVEELLPAARAVMRSDGEPLVQLLIYRREVSDAAGRADLAEAQAQESLSTARQLLGDRHRLTVRASNDLGHAYLFLPHRQKELLAETERGLAFAHAAYGADSIHPLVLEMLSVRAMSFAGVGQLREAIEVQKKSLEGLRRATGNDSLEVVNNLHNLASWNFGTGALKESIGYSREAIAILDKKISRDSNDYGMALATLGGTLLAARQTSEAHDAMAQAERILAQARGETDRLTLRARFNRAVAMAHQGKHKEAMGLLDIVERAEPAVRDAMYTVHMRGVLQRLAGDAAAAVTTQKQALGRIAKGDPLTGYYHSLILPELGLAQIEAGNADAAETALKEFIAASDRQSQAVTPAYAEALVGLGRVELLRNAPQNAAPHFERAVAFWRDFDADNPGATDAAAWLARAQGAPKQ